MTTESNYNDPDFLSKIPHLIALGQFFEELSHRLGNSSYLSSEMDSKEAEILLKTLMEIAHPYTGNGANTPGKRSTAQTPQYYRLDLTNLPHITIKDLAQNIIDDTFGEFSYSKPQSIDEKKQRAALALKIWEDCVDAYFVLGTCAEEERSYKNAISYYKKAMKLAGKKIGPQAFNDPAAEVELSHYYIVGYEDGRRYTRPGAALARLYKKIGKLDQAIDLFSHLIQLDPRDFHGNRYYLMSCLLEKGDDQRLEKELQAGYHNYELEYSGASLDKYYSTANLNYSLHQPKNFINFRDSFWLYTYACWLYRTNPDPYDLELPNEALEAAIAANFYIRKYLLEPNEIPQNADLDGFCIHSPEEAIYYVNMALQGWKHTPGALDWLKKGPYY